MVYDTKSPLNVAIGNLTLKSWESWETRNQYSNGHRLDSQQSSRPEFVVQLLEQRTTNRTNISTESSYSPAKNLVINPPNSHETPIGTHWDFGLSSMADPLASIDWNYWNHLLQDAGTPNTLAAQTNGSSVFER
jgi:hypothetical protein